MLEPERGGLFVDATLGAGGHAQALLERGPEIRLLGIDRDPDALDLARKRLARFADRIELVEENFGNLDLILERVGGADGILADLGVSSMQLDRPERGFSFRRDGPLDMRRSRGPINSTRQLARIVAGAKGGARGKIDPATRVFQALRIEVNQELLSLTHFLSAAVRHLNAGGRIAVVSYHSLEDRMVKEAFRRDSGVCLCPPRLPRCVCGSRQLLKVLTRRPIRPSEKEVSANPRSRSARLRVAQRLEG